MFAQTFNTPVLVVGAGPAGAVLALELARHGVASIVVERSHGAAGQPKVDYLSGRTMELLRRLGLTDAIRATGVPPHHPTDFLWSRGFAEPPVLVWHHPSVDEVRLRYATVNDGSAPVEPHQRVRGSAFEELLRGAVAEHPSIDLRLGWTCTDLWPSAGGVLATVVEQATGERYAIEAEYLAACDGAASTVRQCLDIPLETSGSPTQHCAVHFRSADPALRRHGRASVTIAARGLTLVSRDEVDTWTATVPVPADEPLTDDPVRLVRDRLGVDFAVDQVLDVTQWESRLAVADRYRMGQVYLVGDAAHQYAPLGGYGVNTGLADAVDLGWKLAGTVRGWAGPRLLDSYEAERRPVALFNRELCAGLLEVCQRFGRLSAVGTTREQLAGVLAEEAHQIENLGAQFGSRYPDSPVICAEQGEAPGWDWRRITPTTWPGSRVPAVRLSGGAQLFDRFGPGFTLVDLSGREAGAPLARDATRRGIPMAYLPLDDAAVRACWERELVLVRPDQHAAWRADTPADDWSAVLDRVTGQVATRTRDAGRYEAREASV